MDSRVMNHLAKNPKAMMDFKLRGKVPRTYEPTSPLITLLEQIPASLRGQIRGIQVHPGLGYQAGFMFNNAEQLLRWIKPDQRIIEGQPFPAESRRIKHFQKRLTLEDLKEASSHWPLTEDQERALAARIRPGR